LLRLALEGPVASGALTFEKEGKTVDQASIPGVLKAELIDRLNWFAHAGLLVSCSAQSGPEPHRIGNGGAPHGR
jgi:hypothetical protein